MLGTATKMKRDVKLDNSELTLPGRGYAGGRTQTTDQPTPGGGHLRGPRVPYVVFSIQRTTAGSSDNRRAAFGDRP